MEPISDRGSRRSLYAHARRLRIIGQLQPHGCLGQPARRVRCVHALARGAELPGRAQYSRRGDELARVPIGRTGVPQIRSARRRPAWRDTREHEAEHAAPRAVHARAWRPQLPRPDDPQPRPSQHGTSAGHRHRRPRVHSGGKRVRGPVNTASISVRSGRAPRRHSPRCRAVAEPAAPSASNDLRAGASG